MKHFITYLLLITSINIYAQNDIAKEHHVPNNYRFVEDFDNAVFNKVIPVYNIKNLSKPFSLLRADINFNNYAYNFTQMYRGDVKMAFMRGNYSSDIYNGVTGVQPLENFINKSNYVGTNLNYLSYTFFSLAGTRGNSATINLNTLIPSASFNNKKLYYSEFLLPNGAYLQNLSNNNTPIISSTGANQKDLIVPALFIQCDSLTTQVLQNITKSDETFQMSYQSVNEASNENSPGLYYTPTYNGGNLQQIQVTTKKAENTHFSENKFYDPKRLVCTLNGGVPQTFIPKLSSIKGTGYNILPLSNTYTYTRDTLRLCNKYTSNINLLDLIDCSHQKFGYFIPYNITYSNWTIGSYDSDPVTNIHNFFEASSRAKKLSRTANSFKKINRSLSTKTQNIFELNGLKYYSQIGDTSNKSNFYVIGTPHQFLINNSGTQLNSLGLPSGVYSYQLQEYYANQVVPSHVVYVRIFDEPTITITSVDACKGVPKELTANIVSNSAIKSTTWTTNLGTITNGNILTYNGSLPVTITCTVKYANGDLTVTKSATLNYVSPPIPTYTSTQQNNLFYCSTNTNTITLASLVLLPQTDGIGTMNSATPPTSLISSGYNQAQKRFTPSLCPIGTHKVLVTYIYGNLPYACTIKDSITLTFVKPAVIQLSHSTLSNICTNSDSISLSTIGISKWAGNGVFYSSTRKLYTFVASSSKLILGDNKIYSISQYSTPCQDTTTKIINIIQAPSIATQSNISACKGVEKQLLNYSPPGGIWTKDNTNDPIDINQDKIFVDQVANGNYKLNYTIENGLCKATSSTIIKTVSPPVIIIDPKIANKKFNICLDNKSTINLNSLFPSIGNYFLFDSPKTISSLGATVVKDPTLPNSSLTLNPRYIVTGNHKINYSYKLISDSSACTIKDSITLNAVYPYVTTLTTQSLCKNDNDILLSLNPSSVDIAPNGKYLTSNKVYQVVDKFYFSPSESTLSTENIIYYVQNPLNACVDTCKSNYQIKQNPIITLNNTNVTLCNLNPTTINLPFPLINGTSLNQASNPNHHLYWVCDNSAAEIKKTNMSKTDIFSTKNIGLYNLTYSYTDTDGCSSSESVIFDIKNNSVGIPTITEINNKTSLCIGDSANFEANISTPNNLITYNWYLDQNTSIVSTSPTFKILNNTTDLKVYATSVDELGCESSKTVAFNLPVKYINATLSTSKININSGEFVKFSLINVSGDPITNYLWSFGDNTFATVSNPNHYFYDSGIFPVNVSLTSQTGCKKTLLPVNINCTGTTVNINTEATPTSPNQFGTDNVINLFPNPFTSSFNIDFLNVETNVNYSIYNELGYKIMKGSENAIDLLNINTENLDPGMYYMTITTLSNSKTFKIIKQ